MLKLNKDQRQVYNMVKAQIGCDSALDYLLEDLYKSGFEQGKAEGALDFMGTYATSLDPDLHK